MQTVTWSRDLQSVVRNLKKQTQEESGLNVSQQELHSVQKALETRPDANKVAGEWI
ncbi:MAG: hypothetical protein K0Q59_2720 [Paenibacillus sp.]|jgi:hypothetical protein|nr:hypothetical protein [Paenibacillus sp.]